MADTNYQPQKSPMYGFSNGIPGIVGGGSTPLIDQARYSAPPAVRQPAPSTSSGLGEYQGIGAGGNGSGITPEQSSFLSSETAAERDSRMGKISDMIGKGLPIAAGLTGIPFGGMLVGAGTKTGTGDALVNFLGGLFDDGASQGQKQDSNMGTTGLTANEASARAGYGNSPGFADTMANNGIIGDSNAFGGAPPQADPAGDYSGVSNGGGGGNDAPGANGDGFGGGDAGFGGGSQAFAAGGLVMPPAAAPMQMPPPGGGAPMGKPGLAPPGAPPAPADPRMVDAQAQNLMKTKPETVQKIQMMVQQAIQSGETTPEQVQQLGQIARVCLQNPAMYPKLVQMAEQRGIVQAGELPPTYNEGAVKRLILIAAVVAQSPLGQPGQPVQGGGAPIEMQGQNQAAMRHGGMIRGPGTGTSDSIPGKNTSTGGDVKVSNGEYIIPAKIVSIKGKEFFDNLLRKYSDVSGERA